LTLIRSGILKVGVNKGLFKDQEDALKKALLCNATNLAFVGAQVVLFSFRFF
jgi:hypothetical protein